MPDQQLPLEHRFSHANEDPVGAPYAKGSDTSKAAAEKTSTRIERQRRDVYRCILRGRDEGRTWDEVVAILDCSPSANGRVTELRDRGYIEDSGRRRKTRRGCNAVVWIVTGKVYA